MAVPDSICCAGVLLWGMYTGVPPWQGMRRTQVMFKVTALGATLQIPPNCPPFYKVADKLGIQGYHHFPARAEGRCNHLRRAEILHKL